VIGSAQKRYKDGFLQHGSIVFDFNAEKLRAVLNGNAHQDFNGIGALRNSRPDLTIPELKLIMKKAFENRGFKDAEPCLAHSFERVMPGRDYVSSIRDFWRVCSGINEKAREQVTGFLSDIINVDQYPLLSPYGHPYALFEYSIDNRTISVNATIIGSNTLLNYTWSFGDQSNGYSATANHTYLKDGIYQVTLTLRDSNNRTDESSIIIIINDDPGVTSDNSPSYGSTGDSYIFNIIKRVIMNEDIA